MYYQILLDLAALKQASYLINLLDNKPCMVQDQLR